MSRIGADGQLTIPPDVRECFGLHPDTEVEFEDEDGKLVLKPARDRASRGRRLARTGTSGMTTDEIMALTRGED